MTTTLIRGGRIIDPSQNIDRIGNVLLRDDRIVGIDSGVVADRLIDATGLIVCPGLIDVHVALREPGNEEDETVATATSAALAGGFTSIASMPDTNPPIDNRGDAEFVLLMAKRAGNCNVFPLGSVTKGNKGEELAEIGQLVEGGAVALTDGKHPIANAEIMWRALEYARMFNVPVLNSPQVPELVGNGVMHEGKYSTLLGLAGIPSAAESIMVSRDIALAARNNNCRLHLMCVSTTVSVDLIRRAREKGVQVSCDVTPHHLALTDAELQSFNSNFKTQPPLRGLNHVRSLIEGLKDGTIEIISSDHQPYAEEEKDLELDIAPFGIIGLETLLPICIKTLIEPGHLTWLQLISKLTVGPAKLLGIQKGTLQAGSDADITLIDPNLEWTINPSEFRSKSRNTPFGGWSVRGRATTVLVGGQVRHTLTK